MTSRLRSSLLALALAVGCRPERPARFADAKVIEDLGDDGPSALPRRRDPVKEMRLTEAYVARPMIEALDPAPPPEAGDVNALDEVPRSTWLSVRDAEDAADAAEPPAAPYRFLDGAAVTHDQALAVMDARGRRFEIWRDPPDRPEMATGAAAVASHLLRALGYFTPGVWATDLAPSEFVARHARDREALRALIASGPAPSKPRFRVAMTRWPVGADLGPTAPVGVRSDDTNDRIPHEDRRTLRSLKLVFGWLGMTEADAGVLRDAYLGAPGRGHVVHYIAGLGAALGSDAVVRPSPPKDDDSNLAGQNVWITLGTLGLYRQPARLTQLRLPAVGEYGASFSPADFRTGPPIEPMDRLLPADAYWAAKRIASLQTPILVHALDAGDYHDPAARAAILDLVRLRQGIAIRWGVSQVTPCDVDRLDQLLGRGATLVLRDVAPSLGIVAAGSTTYAVEVVDQTGRRVTEPTDIRLSGGALFPVRIPETDASYVVVRVRASGRPRAMEVHVAHDAARWKVLGVVH